METYVDTGVTGAKRQSYSKKNAREALVALMKRGYEKEEIRTKLWSVVQKDVLMMENIYDYWFGNNYHSSLPKDRRSRKTIAYREAAAAEAAAILGAHIKREVHIKLLDLMTPTGKSVRASSCEELRHCGGWLGRVAGRLQPGQTVVEAGLTENDLIVLYED